MSYLDQLLGTTQPTIQVTKAQPTETISGVIHNPTNDKVVAPGQPATNIGPKMDSMPAVQRPQADTVVQPTKKVTDKNLQPSNIPTEVYQPAAGEQKKNLDSIFNPKVTGAYGTEKPVTDYEEMTPLEKAHYAAKYSQTATSDLLFGPNQDRNVGQKVAGFAFDIIDPFVKDVANIRLSNKLSDEVVKGNVDQSVFDGVEVLHKSNVQIFGDVAQAVLAAYTPNIGLGLVEKSAGTAVLKQGLKELALTGAKEGSLAGLQFGIAQAMSSGSNDPKEIAKIIGLNTVFGGTAGSLLSTAIPAISKVIAGTKNIISEGADKFSAMGFSKEEASRMATEGGFMGINPRAEELGTKLKELNKQYVENPTPANKKALDFTKKAYMQESQGGFIKNPFVKEESPTYNDHVNIIGDTGIGISDGKNKISITNLHPKLQATLSDVEKKIPSPSYIANASPEELVSIRDGMKNLRKELKNVTLPEAESTAIGSIQRVKGEKLVEDVMLQKIDSRVTSLIDNAENHASDKLWKSYGIREGEIPSKVKFELPKSQKSDGFITSLRKTLNPINFTDDTTKRVYNTYTRTLTAAAEDANRMASQFKDIPDKQAWEAVLDYEKGIPNEYSPRIQQTFDDLHKEALSRGLDVPYRENYVPQIYKNSAEEIKIATANFLLDKGVDQKVVQQYVDGIAELPAEVATRLKMSPNFAKARVLPDYQTAMQYGLTPKYTHPGQLAGAYKQEMGRAIAGKDLVQDLVATGKLVGAKTAPSNFEAVNLPFSNKGYYADPTLAKVLNGQFGNESMNFGQKLAAAGAKLSKTAQEIVLSGGVPNSDVNFFSIGQLIKNVTAGDVKAIPAFVRGNFDSASIKWFEKKAPIIQKMSQHGIDLSSRVGKMADMYDNMVASKSIKEALGEGWHRIFERKTFASFMPQLQINTFEGAYKSALKKGLSEIEAGELAAKTTRAFYGLFENTGRSKTAENTMSSLFFAPKFREGVIRTLWNTGKSVTSEIKNPAFSMNRKLAAGMAISYAAYNAANKALNGHYMWDNEPGKEFSLRIPAKDGKIAYVDFMPSFLSLPRSILTGAKALVTGDVKTATQKGTALLSQPVQIISSLASNQDHFGNPIYNENDSTADKMKDISKYLGPQVSHPYMKLISDQLFPNPQFPKPLIQSIMEASELPVKFATEDQLSRQSFYTAIDDKAKQAKADQKKLQPIYDQVQKLKKEGNEDKAQEIVDNLSDDDYTVYKRIKAADKSRATTGAEAKMYKTYEQVQELKKQGKEDQAQQIVDDMSDEDYRIYSLVKNRFSD